MGTGDVIELTLDVMAHGGEALGRHGGKVVFVSEAIPGETVRARVTEERKRWARAERVSVLEPSPDRVEPPCPYFGRCGGCQWQHIAYSRQLDYKQGIVIDQLRRLGGMADPPVRPTIGMGEPWFYRNHVQFSTNPSGRLGFQAAHSHEVVPIDHCLIAHPLLDELHAALDVDWPALERLSLRAGIHTGERMCIFETASDEVPELEVDLPISCVLRLGDGTTLTLIGTAAYYERLRGRRYRISATSFFQVNTEQTETLTGLLRDYLEPAPSDRVLDAYCGVGTLGLSLHGQVERLIGIEESSTAVDDARANAAGSDDVLFIHGKTEELLLKLEERVTKVIVDPPRQGCKPEGIRALLSLRPQRLVYVSCDPATLARDARALGDGRYQLVEVQPVDMFPQTCHVESVSLWLPMEQRG